MYITLDGCSRFQLIDSDISYHIDDENDDVCKSDLFIKTADLQTLGFFGNRLRTSTVHQHTPTLSAAHLGWNSVYSRRHC
jgi:hypothetical protein